MVYIKLITVLVWIIILAVAIVVFFKSVFDSNIFGIRISLVAILLSIPTILSIIKDVD